MFRIYVSKVIRYLLSSTKCNESTLLLSLVSLVVQLYRDKQATHRLSLVLILAPFSMHVKQYTIARIAESRDEVFPVMISITRSLHYSLTHWLKHCSYCREYQELKDAFPGDACKIESQNCYIH